MSPDFCGKAAVNPGADAEARLTHRLGVAGDPLSVALALAQASSGRAAEWIGTREGGRSGYRHKGSVELPLGSGGHAAALLEKGVGGAACAVFRGVRIHKSFCLLVNESSTEAAIAQTAGTPTYP